MSTDQFAPPASRLPKVEKTGGMPIGIDRPHKGRYWDFNTDTSYQRVSNLLKFVDRDRYGLERWFERMTALGLAAREDLLLGVAALGPDGDKEKLDDLCQQAKEHAGSRSGANKGTALHAATERLDRGEHIDNIILPPPFDADLRAYRDLCYSAGFIKDTSMIERTVGIPELDYMGTLDRAKSYRSVNSELSIVDVKTEKDPTYNWLHIAAQLAAYAHGTHIWDNGRLVPLADLGIVFNRAVGYVIHVRDGMATLYAINLTAGWRNVERAIALRADHRDAKSFAIEIPVQITAPPAASLVSAAVAAARGTFRGATINVDLPSTPPSDASPIGGITPDTAAALIAAVPEVSIDRAVAFPGQVTPAEMARDAAPAAGAPVDLIDMLLREVEQADSTARLAELYDMAQHYPGAWDAVAVHAMLREQIVTCKHRELHAPASTARCACGWTRESRP